MASNGHSLVTQVKEPQLQDLPALGPKEDTGASDPALR